MKANKYIALACAVLALGLASCGESQDAPAAVAEVSVVETSFDQAYTASKGRITVDQEGFEVKTDATWLQAVKDGPKSIALTIEKNEAAESRTANVIITKGQTVQRVPITQLGVVNVMTLSDIEAQRQGSEHSFAIDKMDSEPAITVSASWITASVEDKVLKIRVAPFASGETEDRRGTVRVVAGLFDRTINVSQTYGVVAYADLLGEYEASFIQMYGAERKTGTVTIEQKEAGKSYTIKGLSMDLTALFDAKTASLTFYTGEMPKLEGLPENQKIYLAAWGAVAPKADGTKNTSIVWDANSIGMRGTWNKKFEDIAFNFSIFGASADNPMLVLGFFIGETTAQGIAHKDWYAPNNQAIYLFGEMSWTKKKAAVQP